MASISDLTLIFETVGERAAAGGATKVASSVDKIRQGWSKNLEAVGKLQSQLALVGGLVGAAGLNIDFRSGRPTDPNENAAGTFINDATNLGFQLGLGSAVGLGVKAIVGAIPVVGPFLQLAGSLAGAVLGDWVASQLEPIINRITLTQVAIDEKLINQVQSIEHMAKVMEDIRADSFDNGGGWRWKFWESRMEQAEEARDKRVEEILKAIQPQIERAESDRLNLMDRSGRAQFALQAQRQNYELSFSQKQILDFYNRTMRQ